MPVSPSDFEEHADRVDDEFDDEIARRGSISRRYYYIFHRFRAENADHDESEFTDSGGDHQEASKFLRRLGHNDLADELYKLRAKRNKADYDIDKSVGEFEYEMFLADLEDFERSASEEDLI
ncbi:MAG: hypothetical protein ACOCYZ_02165 [Halococcoides sp.]